MRIITNTLLIVTLFTSNIIASQGCANGMCMASFGKKTKNDTVATNVSFNIKSILAISKPLEENQNIINTIQENSENEEFYFPDMVISQADVTTSQFEPIIASEETIIYEEENLETINNEVEDVETLVTAEVLDADTTDNIDILESEDTLESDTSIKLVNNTKTYCEEYQELLACDITDDSSECACV